MGGKTTKRSDEYGKSQEKNLRMYAHRVVEYLGTAWNKKGRLATLLFAPTI
jgi:hypothetical protein